MYLYERLRTLFDSPIVFPCCCFDQRWSNNRQVNHNGKTNAILMQFVQVELQHEVWIRNAWSFGVWWRISWPWNWIHKRQIKTTVVLLFEFQPLVRQSKNEIAAIIKNNFNLFKKAKLFVSRLMSDETCDKNSSIPQLFPPCCDYW